MSETVCYRFNDHPSGPDSDSLTFIHRCNELCFQRGWRRVFGTPKFVGHDRKGRYSVEPRFVEEYGGARVLYPLGFPDRDIDGYRIVAKTKHGARVMRLAMNGGRGG